MALPRLSTTQNIGNRGTIRAIELSPLLLVPIFDTGATRFGTPELPETLTKGRVCIDNQANGQVILLSEEGNLGTVESEMSDNIPLPSSIKFLYLILIATEGSFSYFFNMQQQLFYLSQEN